MIIEVIVHNAQEGGFWAEISSIPGCATQGETLEENNANILEAMEGSIDTKIEQPLLQLDIQRINQGQ